MSLHGCDWPIYSGSRLALPLVEEEHVLYMGYKDILNLLMFLLSAIFSLHISRCYVFSNRHM
jgi:hypothetical protein